MCQCWSVSTTCFSFPLRYFEVHGLKHHWPAVLDDFQFNWPTDDDHNSVDSVRDGIHGNGAARTPDRGTRGRCAKLEPLPSSSLPNKGQLEDMFVAASCRELYLGMRRSAISIAMLESGLPGRWPAKIKSPVFAYPIYELRNGDICG